MTSDIRSAMEEGAHSSLGRRRFLQGAALAGAASLTPAIRAQGATGSSPAKAPGTRPAKNVIFMVADGMSCGTLTLADMLIRQQTGQSGEWVRLWSQPGVSRATMRTHALDSLVTDSAAGGSAWGSGEHLNNGAINVRPDGTQLLPILLKAQARGKGTGVVSTTRITHATPASFFANVPRRDYEGQIARQLLERTIDVALGGGERFFPASLLSKHRDVQVVRTQDELHSASSGRLLGLFHDDHVPFVLDRAKSVPSLEQMALTALKSLEIKTEGFVLQIEGGRVDHAAHANDAGALIQEMIEFNRTIGVVREWIGERTDTLLIITTDHGNGNPGLTQYGADGNKAFARLGNTKQSFEWIAEKMAERRGHKARLDAMPALVKEASGYELSASDLALLGASFEGVRNSGFSGMNSWVSVLGSILADHYGVAWISPNHTADYVEVTAMGPGSELIGPAAGRGCIDNIELHSLMVDQLSLGGVAMPDGLKNKLVMPEAPKPD